MQDVFQEMENTYRQTDEKLKALTEGEKKNYQYYRMYSKPYPLRPRIDEKTQKKIFPDKLEEAFFFQPDVNVALRRHYRYQQIPDHTHTFLEIIYVYEGKILQKIDTHEIELRRGDVCIIAPGIHHNLSIAKEEDIILNILVRKSTFDTAFFDLLTDENILASLFTRMLYDDQMKQFILFHTENDRKLCQIVLDMVSESETRKANQDHILKSWFMLFCGQLLREHEERAEVPNLLSKRDEDITGILHYLQVNYRTVSLASIAQHFHFDEAYLSRLIKEYTGENFRTLLRNIRIHKAAALLKNPDTNVEDIAGMVGYQEISSFYRNFRAQYNMTPSEFREQHFYK